MTDLVRVQETIRGRPDHVRNAIETARRDGRRLIHAQGRPLAGGDVEVVVDWLKPIRAEGRVVDRRPWFRRRPRLAATMVGLLVGFAGLVAWIAYQLVVMVARNFATIAFVAVLVGALILASGHKVTKAVGCCPCHRR
jgi:hypothetical protein